MKTECLPFLNDSLSDNWYAGIIMKIIPTIAQRPANATVNNVFGASLKNCNPSRDDPTINNAIPDARHVLPSNDSFTCCTVIDCIDTS